jgi:hypothetical protein
MCTGAQTKAEAHVVRMMQYRMINTSIAIQPHCWCNRTASVCLGVDPGAQPCNQALREDVHAPSTNRCNIRNIVRRHSISATFGVNPYSIPCATKTTDFAKRQTPVCIAAPAAQGFNHGPVILIVPQPLEESRDVRKSIFEQYL